MAKRIPLSQPVTALGRNAFRKLAVDIGGPLRGMQLQAGKPAVFHDAKPGYIYGRKDVALAFLEGHFDFAGQRLDIGAQGDPWTVAVPSSRHAEWLHGFEWLSDLAVSDKKAAAVRARNLVDKWINVYGKWNPFSWQADILATRLYYWLSLWTTILAGDSLSGEAQIRRTSVLRQLKRLRHVYKQTRPGLSRLRAAAALAMGGARLQSNSDGFLARGLDWLDDEIEVQILPDGGHISRSPEQALDALDILLTLDSFLQSRGVEGSRSINRAIDRLASVITFFQAGDGGLSSFNGSGEGDLARIKMILKAGPDSAKPFSYCPHSGYQRLESEGTILIMDTGETPPRPYDLEAHLAPLAFELSNGLGRLVVNCGWSKSQPKMWRRPVRSTAAHTTLTLNQNSAGRLLPEGWKSRHLGDAVEVDVNMVRAKRKEQSAGIWLESSHDGYREATGLSHRRRLYMSVDGNDIRGEDSLFVPLGAAPISRDEIPFDIRFHFHPTVRVSLSQDQQSALLVQNGKGGWRFRTDGGPMRVEDSVYLGSGNKPVKCQQLVISGRAYADSDGETRTNRVRWSFRLLEGRRK